MTCYTFLAIFSFLAVFMSGRGGSELLQFLVQIGALGQGLRNLLPIDFAKTLSQAMHRHAGRAFIDAQLWRHSRIINRAAPGQEAVLERRKINRFSSRHEFPFQPVQRQVEQRQGPLPVVGFIRREPGGWVGGVAAFGQGSVELDVGQAATAPLRRSPAPFVAHEMFQRHQ